MITKLEQKNKVEVQYEIREDDLIYMDTLLFNEEEMGDLNIEKLVTDKFADWKVYIQTPAKVPTKEEKEREIARLAVDIADKAAKKAQLEREIQ